LKNKIFIAFFFLAAKSWACDFCTLLDFGSINNQTSIRLDYRMRTFKGYNQPINSYTGVGNTSGDGSNLHKSLPGIDKTYINDASDYERYRLLNLGLIYNHRGRLNFVLNVPYKSNTDYYGLVIPTIGAAYYEKNVFKGLGDVNIGLQKIIVKSGDLWKQTFKLGALLYLPTGKYQANDLFSVNVHMQPGRSIYGSEFSANYTLENEGIWGLNINSMFYKPNQNAQLSKAFVYQYAKQFALDAQVFKVFNGEIKKMILGGVKTEWSTFEYINKYKIEDSGYQLMMFTSSFTLKYKQNVLMATADLPVYGVYNGLQLKSKIATSVSVIHYLDKEKKTKSID
jgi:hypothetical protein